MTTEEDIIKKSKMVSIPREDGTVQLYIEGELSKTFESLEKWLDWCLANQDLIKGLTE